jgi:hypothetical protein
MLNRHLSIVRVSRAWAMIAILGLLAGCASELDPTEPEGAYYLFRDAMLQGDGEEVWKRTDAETHRYFQERYEDLVDMEETIEKFLPQTDHRIARKQSGAILLDEVDDGRELFLKIFTPENIPDDQAIRIGSDIDELILAEDESAAKVVTRAGQEYVLTRDEESEKWRVMLVRSSESIEESMGWVGQNESALQQTVEDLIAEERDKREAIIAELMNLKEE